MDIDIMTASSDNAGGHAIFNVLPFFLKLHEKSFGSDLDWLDVVVYFQSNTQTAWDERFEDRLARKKLPRFRFYRKNKKLAVEYATRVCSAELKRRSERVEYFGAFHQEFVEIMEKNLRSSIRPKDNFDLDAFLRSINPEGLTYPTTEEELAALNAEDRIAIPLPRWARGQNVYEGKEPLPKSIPVKRFAGGLHSSFIGTFGQYRHQFWGQVSAFADGDAKDWFAVVHKFDSDGTYLDADFIHLGKISDKEAWNRGEEALLKLLDKLEDIDFGDIQIKLFEKPIQNKMFRLYDTSFDEIQSLTMEPSGLTFNPPWNGEYSS